MGLKHVVGAGLALALLGAGLNAEAQEHTRTQEYVAERVAAQEQATSRRVGGRRVSQQPTDPDVHLDARVWSGAVFFHWYGMNDNGLPNGQYYSPWLPLEGREQWTGSVDFYARQTLFYAYAGFNMLPFQDLYTRTEDQRNHLKAIHELGKISYRRNLMRTIEHELGTDVFQGVEAEELVMPKISPFIDQGSFEDASREKDFTKQADKEELYSHIHDLYQDVIDTLGPEGFAWHQGKVLTNFWYVPGAQSAKKDLFPWINEQLKKDFDFQAYFSTHYAWNKARPDEINYLFSGSTKPVEWNIKGNVDLLTGYWPPDNAPHSYWVPRNGGRTLRQGLSEVLEKFKDVCTGHPKIIWWESWNEYTEGSGLYPAQCAQMPADAYSGEPERTICLDTPCLAKRDSSWYDMWTDDCSDPRAPFLYMDMAREYNLQFLNWRQSPEGRLDCWEGSFDP